MSEIYTSNVNDTNDTTKILNNFHKNDKIENSTNNSLETIKTKQEKQENNPSYMITILDYLKEKERNDGTMEYYSDTNSKEKMNDNSEIDTTENIKYNSETNIKSNNINYTDRIENINSPIQPLEYLKIDNIKKLFFYKYA